MKKNWIALVFNLFIVLTPISHASDLSQYSNVNSLPQIGMDENTFSFYWAVWRSLSREEEKRIKKGGGGALLSQRDLSWEVRDCENGTVLNQDGERIWFLDAIRFNSNGYVIPLKESGRPGYLYLVMANANALYFRNIGPFVPPRRLKQESYSAFQVRRNQAFDTWFAQASPMGTKGHIDVLALHRLFDRKGETFESEFVTLEEYRSKKTALANQFSKYRPDRWPIFWDERAHKPHSLQQPSQWDREFLTENKLRMRFEWDACDRSRMVKAAAHFPKGGIPASGENRPGIENSGGNPIKIVEDLD